MDDNKKLFHEKIDRVAKTIRREKVDKPPFMFIADGYYPYYAGVEKSAVTTYEQAVEITRKVSDDLQYDTCLIPFFPANLMTAPMLEILRGGCHVVKDFSKQISPDKVVILQPGEYPELIKDPVNYLLENVYPRRYGLLKDATPEEKYQGVAQVMQEVVKIGQYYQACEDAGSPIVSHGTFVISPVDYLFDFFRDFTGIVNDIKRCPELVRDAGMAILEGYKPILKAVPCKPHKAIFIPMHIPPFLRPKDFEKVYWPSYKALIEYIVAQGNSAICYYEKKFGHLFDYLQDLPKQGVIGMFQEDDIRVVKEKLGSTMAIAGGLSTTILQHGTKEQCIDHVKGLIEDLAPGGGYFIAPDTPMMFPVDGRPENLKAVADYIRDSRI